MIQTKMMTMKYYDVVVAAAADDDDDDYYYQLGLRQPPLLNF